MATELETQTGEILDASRSISPGPSQPMETSIERGTRLLGVLKRAAKAARLDMQVAELQAALLDAHAGRGLHLERCLENLHDQDSSVATDPEPATVAQAILATATLDPASPDSGRLDPERLDSGRLDPERLDPAAQAASVADGSLQAAAFSPHPSSSVPTQGWAAYLPHAERRLRALGINWLGDRPVSQIFRDTLDRKQTPPFAPEQTSARDADIDIPALNREVATTHHELDDCLRSDEVLVGRDTMSNNALALDTAVATDSPCSDSNSGSVGLSCKVDGDVTAAIEWGASEAISSDAAIDLLCVKPALDEEERPAGNSLDVRSLQELGPVSDRTAAPSELLTRRTLSGVGLSVIGHALLLTALFLMTYRASREPASLGSQVLSLNEVSENIEIGQSFELPDLVELDVTETSAETLMEPAVADLARNDLAGLEQSFAVSALDPSNVAAGQTAVSSLIAAGSGGAGGGSGKQGTGHGKSGVPKLGGQFFGVGAGGNFFCYVVDSSGSMRGGAWESAKLELLRSLSTLTPMQRFYIIFFAKEVSAIPEPGQREPATHGLLATAANIDHARRWIETVKLDRGGPPNDALAMAIERQPDAIYLLTDGVTKVDVCGFLRENNRISDIVSGSQVRVPIHPIAYFSLDGQKLLRQVAQENEGQFHYVPPK